MKKECSSTGGEVSKGTTGCFNNYIQAQKL